MKKTFAVFCLTILILISIGLMSCRIEDNTLEPISRTISTEKGYRNFSEISVSNGFQLFITQDGTESVRIETSQNLLPYIISYQKDGLIVLKREENIHFAGNAVVKIFVSVKDLNQIYASGGSIVKGETVLSSTNLGLDFSGGSILNAKINSRIINGNFSGGSIFDLTGTSEVFNIVGSGGCILDGSRHQTDNLTANISGGSIFNMTVHNSLSLIASGGSIITYYGDGKVLSNITSGGSIVTKK